MFKQLLLHLNRYLAYIINAAIVAAILAGIGWYVAGLFSVVKT